MKLFQRLLVAPAALGLLAPITANATELNLNDVAAYSNEEIATVSNFSEIYPTDWAFQAITDVATSRGFTGIIPSGVITRYEAATIIYANLKDVVELTEQEQRLISEFSTELAVLQARLDGLETRMNDFEAGSFSTTTTATFSADFAIGAVDGGENTTDDDLNAGYGFQIDLNTSFTGEDSFDVSIDAGTTSQAGYSEFDLNDASETLTVDGISYTFPLAGFTVLVGDTVDGSVLFDYACVYGTPTDTMDDCGAPSTAFVGGGTTLAASYDFENGWYAAFGYAGSGDTVEGLMTDEGLDTHGLNLSYTADNYGLSVSYASVEATTTSTDTFFAFNGYWTPDGFPSISAGYEVGHDDSVAGQADGLSSYFLGVQFEEVGPGTLGVAFGTKTATVEDQQELMMYEAFYSYSINDGMTITPVIYIKEFGNPTNDETGVMVKTSFSF